MRTRQPVHTSEQFTFLANARVADVFPLFGADTERLWAPGWEPRFVWPAIPTDRAGMVFQTLLPRSSCDTSELRCHLTPMQW
jgi:hypothetical protein